tara:strand:- start:1044 stop:1253 length:210 start_codon:yes stop_codon:yes gene_type:complete
MDRDNIIEEGLFDKLKKYFKDRKKYDKLTRILMKDPKWKKAYKDAEKAVDDYHKLVDKELKKAGLKGLR